VQFLTAPGLLLRAEGLALLLVAVLAYSRMQGNWIAFFALLLVPDLGMVGYLRNTRLGAAIYNLVHAQLLPAALLAYWLFAADATALALAIIWFAHIGMDRLFGFGLKYPTRFGDTHLQHS